MDNSVNDDEILQALIDAHARNVSLSAEAWSTMKTAQDRCSAARKLEHASAEAIEKHIKKRIKATINDSEFMPVELDIRN